MLLQAVELGRVVVIEETSVEHETTGIGGEAYSCTVGNPKLCKLCSSLHLEVQFIALCIAYL